MAKPDVSVAVSQYPRLMSFNGISIREDTIYCDHKGNESKRIRKFAEKTLGKMEEPLRRLLERDETILYVAQAQAPASVFEQVTFGWYIYLISRTILVFTNRRMLHLLVDSRGTWKRSLRTVRWGDLEQAQIAGLLSATLTLKSRNGKKQKYWGIRRADANNIKKIAPALVGGSVGESTSAQGMIQVCPDCLATLNPGEYQCAQCALSFKDESTLVRRSLLIPGGGYFYVGQTFLGIGDFIAEAYLLVLLLVMIAAAFIAPQPGQKRDPTGDVVIIVFLAAVLALEKWGTIHHCKRMIRDYIPTGQKLRGAAMAASGGMR